MPTFNPESVAAPILRSVKNGLLKAANYSGISSLVAASQWRRKRLLVLCYHGVSQLDEHEWSDLYISPERLEQRLEQLQKLSATVLPLQQGIRAMYSGELPSKAVAITFDDGTVDYARKAMPLLESAQMHSTYYLATYYCNKDMPVFTPFISYLLWKGRGRHVTIPRLNYRTLIPEFTADKAFTALHKEIARYAIDAGMDASDKDEFARSIGRAVGVDVEALYEQRILHLMNSEQLRSLDRSLTEPQLHTHRHRTPTSLDDLRCELSRNAAEITRLTGREVPSQHFCYPSGIYNGRLQEWLAQCGVISATTCEPNYANSHMNPYAIPRFIDTMSVSESTFAAWIQGSAAIGIQRR